jgi:hypothetical protein
MRPLVFIHVPKCGGTSVLAALRSAYRPRQIITIYRRSGEAIPTITDKHRVIVGHVHAADAARLLPDGVKPLWATIVREPVSRVVSQWAVWRTSEAKPHASPLRKNIASGDMDILSYARLPHTRRLYSDYFFRDFPIARFNVIITQDDFNAGIEKLSQLIKRPLAPQHRNESVAASGQYETVRREILSDQDTMDQLRAIMAKDSHLYERMAERARAKRVWEAA